MAEFSTIDWSASPPVVTVPPAYNAAVDFIDRNLEAGRADKIAVIDDRGSYSYGALAERVGRAGNMLRGLGVIAGQRVAMVLLDGIDFPAVFSARSRSARSRCRSTRY